MGTGEGGKVAQYDPSQKSLSDGGRSCRDRVTDLELLAVKTGRLHPVNGCHPTGRMI